MEFERLIARRFLRRGKDNFSRPLVHIATFTIALGVAMMIMSVCILRGFQREITEKIVGFGSHITIRSYGWINDYDEIPIVMSGEEVTRVEEQSKVAHIQPFANKGGMLKTEDQIQGVIYKGMSTGYDSLFFKNNLVRGRLMHLSDTNNSTEIVVSERLAQKMRLDTGSKARVYFWSKETYRARAFRVVGIYKTDLSEFDDHYIVGDIKQVQRLNGWESGEVAGYEVLLTRFDQLNKGMREVKEATRPDLLVSSIVEEQPALFAWLELLNSNIVLILIIMSIVCATSVVSALLIMIFERTSMIGLLKIMGSTNRSIRKIFMLKSTTIIVKGIVIGNFISLILCMLQNRFRIIHLDSESYSMEYVPIELNVGLFLIISIATVAVCLLALLIPSTYIAHIDPAKTIRVE